MVSRTRLRTTTAVFDAATFDLCVLHQLPVVDVSSLLQTLADQVLHLLRRDRSGDVLHQHLEHQRQSRYLSRSLGCRGNSRLAYFPFAKPDKTNCRKVTGLKRAFVSRCSANSKVYGRGHGWAGPRVGGATCGTIHPWAAPPSHSRPEERNLHPSGGSPTPRGRLRWEEQKVLVPAPAGPALPSGPHLVVRRGNSTCRQDVGGHHACLQPQGRERDKRNRRRIRQRALTDGRLLSSN